MKQIQVVNIKKDLNKEERKKILIMQLPLEGRIKYYFCQHYKIKTVGDLLNFYMNNSNSKLCMVPKVGDVSVKQIHGFIKKCFPEEYEERNKNPCRLDEYRIIYTY